MAIPIDEYLTDEDRERYGDTLGVQNINTYEGKTYSLPAYGNNYRLIYNRDIFRKAGLDPTLRRPRWRSCARMPGSSPRS